MDLDNDVISKLKFIGKIQKGEKVNVKNMNVQADTFATKLSRTFIYFENRGDTLTFVTNTIKKSFELINHHLHSKHSFDKIISENIIKDLKESVKGLGNLKETYATDVMFCCKLDTLIEEIKARLIEINRYEDEKEVVKIEEKKEEIKQEVEDKKDEKKEDNRQIAGSDIKKKKDNK